MARVKVQHVPLGQIAVDDATPETIAAALGLSTDEECLFPAVIIQADPGNSDEVYLGGVDAAGVADAAQNKCIKLTADRGIAYEADENSGDEDQVIYDLRQMSLLAPVAGQLVNVSVVKIAAVQYNR